MESINTNDQSLTRIIVEATNRCNLNCSMCIRRSWNHKTGNLSLTTFSALLNDIQEIYPIPEIFFGGYGEPLSHPDIIYMIQKVKATGARAGLVSNGTLLSTVLSRGLILSGLDKLWISLDNIHLESILEDRIAQTNRQLFQLLKDLLDLKKELGAGPEVGLVFVLNRNNSPQILELIKQGYDLGLRSFSFTNLEAFSEEMAGETLYREDQLRRPNSWISNHTELSREIDGIGEDIKISGSLRTARNRCPFAEKGELVLRWDGEVSPCLPLLYDHTSYIGNWKHQIDSHSLGKIPSRSFHQIWSDKEFITLRDRLLSERFSPCLSCRDCWLSDDNLMDCMGYEHPTCGGCLWAHGIVSCP